MTSASTGSAAGDHRRDVRIQFLVVAAAFALYALIVRGHIDNMDSRIHFATAWNLVEHGTWSLRGTEWESHRYVLRGIDGESYMQYGPGSVVPYLPGVVVGRWIGALTGLDAQKIAGSLSSITTPVAAALTLAALYRIGRRLRMAPREAVLVCAVHGLATYALVYARSLYYETAMGCLLVWAAAFLLRACEATPGGAGPGPVLSEGCGGVTAPGRVRHPPGVPSQALSADGRRGALVGAGLCLAGAVSMKLANVVLVPAILALAYDRDARTWLRRSASVLLPTVLVCVAIVLWNRARFGSTAESGYGKYASFETPLVDGLRRVLVSDRAGWFVFSPVLVLAVPGVVSLWRRSGRVAAAAVLSVVAIVLLSAKYTYPEGGQAYGARYLVPVTAWGSLAAGAWLVAARGVARKAGLALLVVSALVQVPATIVTHQDFWQVHDAHTAAERERLPPTLAVYALLAREKVLGRDDPYDLSVLGVAPPGRTLAPVYPALPGLSPWWARAVRNYGRPWAATAALPLVALGLLASLRLRRELAATADGAATG